MGLPIVGLIENMSGFVCPHCSECSDLFSSGGGENLADSLDIRFLGRVPIGIFFAEQDPALTTLIEKSNFAKVFTESQIFPIFDRIAKTFGSISEQ